LPTTGEDVAVSSGKATWLPEDWWNEPAQLLTSGVQKKGKKVLEYVHDRARFHGIMKTDISVNTGDWRFR
jgi:hypothetical protein